MESIYDEIEIEDFTYDATTGLFQYPCPCGDRFAITMDDLKDGEDIAVCPSCSLMVRVIFEPEDLAESRRFSHAPVTPNIGVVQNFGERRIGRWHRQGISHMAPPTHGYSVSASETPAPGSAHRGASTCNVEKTGARSNTMTGAKVQKK